MRTSTLRDAVLDWQKQHPAGTKKDCRQDTGFALSTIRKWWSPALSRRPHSREIIADWRAAHPTGTPAQCADATGLSQSCVYEWWHGVNWSAAAGQIEAWCRAHPTGSKAECARDLGISRILVSRYFRNTARPRRGRARASEVFTWQRNHPAGTFIECAEDLGIPLTTLARYWDPGRASPVPCPLCGGLLLRFYDGQTFAYIHFTTCEPCFLKYTQSELDEACRKHAAAVSHPVSPVTGTLRLSREDERSSPHVQPVQVHSEEEK